MDEDTGNLQRLRLLQKSLSDAKKSLDDFVRKEFFSTAENVEFVTSKWCGKDILDEAHYRKKFKKKEIIAEIVVKGDVDRQDGSKVLPYFPTMPESQKAFPTFLRKEAEPIPKKNSSQQT